ncbi:hypothetical protein H0H93_013215 [Arthromyces matolae]|nr:hypothetical protein H0H93_013215 [Arthromyces matolae]
MCTHKLLGEKKGDKLDLNQRLACLSRRLPIDFYPTSSNLQVQKKQVDGHLRVCVRVGDHFENMVTTSPSEPLLSEVAARLLYPLSSHDVLSKVMYGFDVNRGDRGEFIALQLLMDARDAVLYKWRGVIKGVIRQGNESYDFDLDDSLPIDWDLIEDDIPLTFSVTDFLKELLSKNDIDNINPYSRKKNSLYNARHTLKDIFATARMNFNHAVKVQSFSAITPSTLPSFISRSSAALCANNQYAIDAVTFFTFESLGLLRTPGIGVILYQFKTSAQCTRELCEDHLFDTMDPFELGILEEGDETPIIRIIFSFGAEAEIVPRTWKHGKLRPKFTTFDIWVGGISSKIFRPVKREEESAWKSILEASSPNIQIYNATTPGADAQKISRSQCPLVSGEKEFHSFFDYETKSIKKSTENNALPGPSRIKGKHRQGGSDELANRTFETYFEGPLTPLSLSSDDEDVDLRTMKHESGQPASHKRKQEDHAPENELPSGQSVGLGITGFTTGFPTKRLRK